MGRVTVTAIIGGTGAALFPGGQLASGRMIDTRWGAPSAPVETRETAGRQVLFLPRHGPDGAIPPHRVNYRANIAALASLGVERIVALNAVGGIAADAAPGAIVVPAQLIDYTWGRAHTYFDSEEEEQQFVDLSEPYSNNLREKLIDAARTAGVPVVARGTYGVTQGPRLETPAEIDRLERDGCTIVGMTSMPEAALAAELGLDYACLALVVNCAAGRGATAIHAEIEAYLQVTVEAAATIIEAWVAAQP